MHSIEWTGTYLRNFSINVGCHIRPFGSNCILITKWYKLIPDMVVRGAPALQSLEDTV